MSLKVRRLALPLFLIMMIPSIVSGADQPDLFDLVYDVGTFWLKQQPLDTVASFGTEISGHTITAEIPLGAAKLVPFGMIKAVIENPPPQNWYDPFWDSFGWGLAKDSASFGSQIQTPGAKEFFTGVGFVLTVAQNNNDVLMKVEDELGITDFWLSAMSAIDPSTKKLLDSASESASPSSKLSQQGLGSPQLSPTSDVSVFSNQDKAAQNKAGTDVSETSGDLQISKSQGDVWYYGGSYEEWGALLWKDYNPDKYPILPAPRYLPSGEVNEYGYGFIFQPGCENILPLYRDWAEKYLASIGSVLSTGYGPLVNEGLNGEDGW
jgi:hypothetical protein